MLASTTTSACTPANRAIKLNVGCAPPTMKGKSIAEAPFTSIAHTEVRISTATELARKIFRSEEHSLNSSHVAISYAVFCLKKKKKKKKITRKNTTTK